MFSKQKITDVTEQVHSGDSPLDSLLKKLREKYPNKLPNELYSIEHFRVLQGQQDVLQTIQEYIDAGILEPTVHDR